MRKGSTARFLTVIAVAALAVLASSTAGSAQPLGNVTPSATGAAKDGGITLGLPGIPPVFLGVRPYVAQQDGFYKKFGANVTLKQFTTGTDALRAVNAGQIEAAWAPTPTALALISKGADLVGIEGMDVVDWEVGSIDSSIATCPSLKGQTIGVDTIGGARYAALQAMLRKCKLDIKDVKTVNFPGAASMQAMIAGQLKVSVLHIDEQAQIEQVGHRKVYISTKLTQVDPYQHYDMLVTTRAQIKAHYYDFVKLLAGDIATTRYMYNPKNITNISKIARITGDSQGVAAQALKTYIKIQWWPLDRTGLGQGRITRTIGLNVKIGNIKPEAAPTWKQVVDTRMWKAGFNLVTKK
ncbi:MAG: ABC transporter substrate-binding protein, partial [Actinomycetota bacterium]